MKWETAITVFEVFTDAHERWLNGVWMCDCAHRDLRERMRERRSWCDEKLNDPSATLCIFAVQMSCRRITVTNKVLDCWKQMAPFPVDLDNSQHAHFKRLIRGSCTRGWWYVCMCVRSEFHSVCVSRFASVLHIIQASVSISLFHTCL